MDLQGSSVLELVLKVWSPIEEESWMGKSKTYI
jgi:hypothetical protein